MEKPTLIAFLFSDKVFREAETGKVHVAGTFNQIMAQKVPVLHPFFATYLAMTGLQEGEHGVTLELRYFESGVVLLKADQKIRVGSPIDVVEMSFHFNRLVFNEFGNVEFVLSADGQMVGTRTLRIREYKAPENTPDL